jgi:hypothetical protein
VAVNVALLVIVATALLLGAAWAFSQRGHRMIDDRLALRLAADLGASAPSLVRESRAQEWRIGLDERTEVLVGAHAVRVRRQLDRPAPGFVTIVSAPLSGRAQEDYALSRMLVPMDDGWWGSPGPSGQASLLEPWEARLVFTGLAEKMERAGVMAVTVDGQTLCTGARGEPHADDVRAMASLLSEIARR